MAVYLLNFAIILLYLLIYKTLIKDTYENENWFLTLCFIQLICISGLRGPTVGADTLVYIDSFLDSVDKPFNSNTDIGFVLIREFFSFFFGNPQLFIFCIAAMSLYSFYKFISYNSPDKILSCYLFISMGYFGFSMNCLRQFMAMAVLIHSIDTIRRKQLLKFLLFLIIAILFHKTAIVFILIYPLAYLSIKSGLCFLLLIISVMPIIGIKIFETVANLIGFTDFWYYIAHTTNFNTIIVLSMVCVYIVALIFRKQILNEDKKNIIYYNLLILSIIMQFSGNFLLGANRLAYYFYVFSIILIPKILRSINPSLIRYLGYILIILLTTLQFILTALFGDVSIYPYCVFWSNRSY